MTTPLSSARPNLMGSDPDAPLVQRVRQGDQRAFDELYRRHADLVSRRLLRLVGADSERDDLIQQVFVDAYRALPRFRGDAAFASWLFRIVVNVAYAHLRSRRRRPVEPLDEQILTRLIQPGSSPEARAWRSQELEQALSFLERLKPKKRIAFLLRHVEGLSLEEIGELVGARPAAVGQRIKHAQRELEAMVALRQRQRIQRGEA